MMLLFITMLCPKFSFLRFTVFVSQANQISYDARSFSQRQFIHVQCTQTKKNPHLEYTVQWQVNKVRYVERPRKSEALTESWPSYFTHFCFYEVMHSVS